MSADPNTQAVMDPTQAARMDEMMRRDLREKVKELEALKAEKDAFMKEQASRSAEYEEMKQRLEAVKDEKRRNFSEIVANQVTPFMEGLKKDQSPNVVKNLTRYENTIANGLDNAFMTDDEQAMYTTVTAAASQLAATSSELEKMFQSDKVWTTKYSALQKERDDISAANEVALKEAAAERELKEKMLEDLKKELGELKSRQSKDMMSADNMLEKGAEAEPALDASGNTTSELEQPMTVTANASNKPAANYDSIYSRIESYQPRPDWRTVRRDGW